MTFNYIAQRYIRRKAASDLEQSSGRDAARQLLGHSNQNTTGIYISGVQHVKPLEPIKEGIDGQLDEEVY